MARVWVKGFTKADGTKVKGHWRETENLLQSYNKDIGLSGRNLWATPLLNLENPKAKKDILALQTAAKKMKIPYKKVVEAGSKGVRVVFADTSERRPYKTGMGLSGFQKNMLVLSAIFSGKK